MGYQQTAVKVWCLAGVIVGLLAGCDTDSNDTVDTGDSNADTHTDTDTDTDDARLEDAGPDTDVDTEFVGDCTGEGVWQDNVAGLCWENPPIDSLQNWTSSTAYCGDLSLNGLDNWRLPTVDESRSLIKGCPVNEIGGECAVTDEGGVGVGWSELCAPCQSGEGPGEDGCYWDDALDGSCVSYYWTSTTDAEDNEFAWGVGLEIGHIGILPKTGIAAVRCVSAF